MDVRRVSSFSSSSSVGYIVQQKYACRLQTLDFRCFTVYKVSQSSSFRNEICFFSFSVETTRGCDRIILEFYCDADVVAECVDSREFCVLE